ncbi:hypothetical protein D6833_12535 [Candidatus Parcubacteria bacterium]|nr:MAG: hypothetical protein D6833_12535 [Candidatus Parcubacteria bacterium]
MTEWLFRPHAFFATCAFALLLSVAPQALAQEACLDCHGDKELTSTSETGEEISLYVDARKFANSVHGDFDCTDCHVDVEQIPHPETLEKVDCGMCHDDAALAYAGSVHGEALAQGAEEAPSCADCHGEHDILAASDPASPVYPLNEAATCAVCHANPKIVKKYHIPVSDPLSAYRRSVHGLALMSEKKFEAATCTSCHGVHDIKPLNDSASPIYWKNVPGTCGKCHAEIYQQYRESVHGKAVEKGIHDAPVCTDCHGEHEVRSPQDPNSPVHPLRVSKTTCERCHASQLITEQFGLPADRVRTFEQSYHGLAIKAGSLSAANCASCHGIHFILPSSDPRSTVNPANLQNTCGKCHKDATANFARGPVHLTASTTPGRVVQMVKNLYVGLIVVVVGSMFIHNAADFVRRARRRLRAKEET